MSRPEIRHDVRLTDTTLRDGSHAQAHQFTEEQVRDTVRALDRAGVEVIEVTHGDGLGGSSFNYGFSHTDELELIAAAREEARQAKIAVLLVPGIGTVEDLRRARDAGADVVRVATHCTEADVSPQHFGVARDLGMETVGFLMMAHRTSPEDLAKQARIMVDAGCQCPYVTDSAGALLMHEARARFEALLAEVGDEAWVGYHGHQNLSMGVANSVIAAELGVKEIDGSLCALGAGSGNSPTEVLAAVFDTWASPPASTSPRCWTPPRTSCAPTCTAGRRWTATPSPRGGRASTPASCCTPSTRASATRSRCPTSCAAAASWGSSAGRRT